VAVLFFEDEGILLHCNIFHIQGRAFTNGDGIPQSLYDHRIIAYYLCYTVYNI